MVPSTVVGVLVFVASVGPGYVYVKTADRWRPYAERTALRETAQIVVTGSIATVVGVVVALVLLGKHWHFIDLATLSRRPGNYIATNPGRAGVALAIVLLVSYGLAWLVARFAPGRGAEVFPDSGWFAAFERRLPRGHAIRATVELVDGRRVTGLVQAFTAEQTPVDDRELTLTKSLSSNMKVVLPPDSAETELNDQFIMLRGSDIRNISASYVPVVE